jgi:hypothetical protein
MKRELYCPCCKSKLEITHKDHYQDLGEHVSNPNGIPSMKDGYQCSNDKCVASMCDVAWIEDGDCFYGERPETITYTDLRNALELNTGNSFAINSWNYYYQLGKDAVKRRTIKINLKWYKFNIVPKELGYAYPIEKEYQPSWWRWKLEIWKRSGEHSHILVLPFWRMTRHCVGNFKRLYIRWKENGGDRAITELYRITMGLDICNIPDSRFYVNVTKVWLRIFHYRKVKEIINFNKH